MKTHGVVYLMAGSGPGTGRKAVRYHDELVAKVGKKKPTIAYVGAASGDNLGFEKMIGTLVFGLFAKVVPVRLTKKSLATSEAKAKLADADIVFFTGGDVDHGMRVIDDRGLAPFIRELNLAGKPMEGISAGAILLGKHWVRFGEEGEEGVVEPFDCLGVVPWSFDAHGEADEWEELVALAKVLPKKKGDFVCGLVSGRCGLYEAGRLHAVGGALHCYEPGTAKRLPDLEA